MHYNIGIKPIIHLLYESTLLIHVIIALTLYSVHKELKYTAYGTTFYKQQPIIRSCFRDDKWRSYYDF